MTPTPLETGHISVEEQEKQAGSQAYHEGTGFFEDPMPQVRVAPHHERCRRKADLWHRCQSLSFLL